MNILPPNGEVRVSAPKSLQEEMIKAYALANYEMTQERLETILKRRQDKDFSQASYEELGVFLDGLVLLKRGPSDKVATDEEAVPLTNNLILKK